MINQQFRLLFAGQGVSVVGDALFPVALAFAVLDDLDGTPAQLGIVLAAQTVPMAVLILASGVWADRLNRRNVMIISDLGRAAVQATLAILLISGTAELWQMIVLVAIYGTFEAGFAPAAGGLVPDVAGREHLQQANALLGLARNTGMVLEPVSTAVLRSSGAAAAEDRYAHKYIIAITVTMAAMLELIDTSIVNVAIPHMMGNLGATLDEIAWVSTGYIIANVIVIPMSGWLSAYFGRKRYFTGSILLFTVASFFCGSSHLAARADLLARDPGNRRRRASFDRAGHAL